MAITAAMVKELREVSGAGMMDCKKALTATEGDMDKAMEFLREKGLATAQKKAGRIAAEGIVMNVVSEDGKKAVSVEVNAETDFVAKNEDFRAFVRDLCMHIAAASPICIKREEVPAELLEKEREIAMAQMAEDKKPEAIKQKIVDGKIDKFIAGVALLEQPFVKDDKLTIEQLLTQKIATIGEKIEIKRFTRYQI